MTVSFKKGITLYGLKSEMLWAIDRANEIWPTKLVVTSACGGRHSRTSLHYVGLAVDLRTRDLTQDQIDDLVIDLRDVLGERYDVLFEHNHIHIEYQPKNAIEYPK